MTTDEANKLIQATLAQAKELLDAVGKLADDYSIEVDFLESRYVPYVGWRKVSETVEAVWESSDDWLDSGCTIE